MDSLTRSATDAGIILLLLAGVAMFRSPRTARVGNGAAALALAAAIALVLGRHPVGAATWLVLALAAGGALGLAAAYQVNMLQIPAMIAFQHGAGGLAAVLISLAELWRGSQSGISALGQASGILGLAIGAATFSGSLIASGKLIGWLRPTPTLLPKHGRISQVAAAAVIGCGALAFGATGNNCLALLLVLLVLSVSLGIVVAIRIGGADMPVLISFLNATAGFAAAFCGVILSSPLLVACGAVVAASGSILTHVMCRAMNRRLWQVFLGFRAGSITAPKSPLSPASPAGEPAGRTPAQSPNHGSARADRSAAKAAEPQPDRVGESNARCGSDDPRSERAAGRGSPSPGAPAPAALTTAAQQPATLDAQTRAVALFRAAHKVIIVPGYGMAVAQAQAEVVELAGWLQRRGTEVSYAIHPVAGRMPGHMNVLLAEADVDYDLLKEMDDINPQFAQCDVAVVVGACDVVNPAANTVPDTPISGMPILRVDQAAQVVVCNLDGRPGYSGVRNPLYEDPKTVLLFGDAKASLRKLLVALEA